MQGQLASQHTVGMSDICMPVQGQQTWGEQTWGQQAWGQQTWGQQTWGQQTWGERLEDQQTCEEGLQHVKMVGAQHTSKTHQRVTTGSVTS